MSYRIGYYTTASPLYGAKLAFWRHHDAIFNELCQESEVELHVILPVYGGSKFMSRLYAGDRSVLYPTLRTMNLVFHQGSREELRDVWNSLDALYLDDVHTFSDIEYEGVLPYRAGDLESMMEEVLEISMHRRIPILLSDTDGFCTDVLEDAPAFMLKIYEKLLKYNNWKLISPFLNPKVAPQDIEVVPFEVDPSLLNHDLKSLHERSYFCRMVKNFYYNEYYLPILDKMTTIGHVLVNGSGWNPYKSQYPSIDFKVGIPMTPESVTSIYNDSVVSMVGRNQKHIEWGTEIYLYRWKEYLTAGTLIVPEDLKTYTDLLPDGTLTTDDYLYDIDRVVSTFTEMTDTKYLDLIESQRSKALEFFSVDRWVPVFKKYLGVKN